MSKSILASLQLARVGLVLTAVSNVWVVALLTRALSGGPSMVRDLPLWAYLASTAVVAIGMYTFGMVLNDLLDLRRDRALSPEKPLPSGRVRTSTATALAIAGLLASVAASVPLGTTSTLLTLLTATVVLFYNGPGKYATGWGILSLGAIRALHMLIANPALGYVWPVWLTMTHVIGVSAACHRLEGKRPMLTGRQIWIVVMGWAFLSVAMIGWMARRGWLAAQGLPWMWVGPTVAAIVFVWIALRTARGAAKPAAAGGLLMKRGLMWLIVYDALWMAGAGQWVAATVIGALLPVTYLVMATIRHVNHLASGPPEFQR